MKIPGAYGRPAALFLDHSGKSRHLVFPFPGLYKMYSHDFTQVFYILSIILSIANSHFHNMLLP